jgi:hypothetical protein
VGSGVDSVALRQDFLPTPGVSSISYHSNNATYPLIQGVPLATEPGISLIIITPKKILQRNLNRNTFVVVTFLTQ